MLKSNDLSEDHFLNFRQANPSVDTISRTSNCNNLRYLKYILEAQIQELFKTRYSSQINSAKMLETGFLDLL